LAVSFELRPEDWLAYMEYCVRNHPAYRRAIAESQRRSRQWAWLLSAICVLNVVALVAGKVFDAGGVPAFAGAGATFLAGWCAVIMLRAVARGSGRLESQYDQMNRAMARRGEFSVDLGRIEITIGADGVHGTARCWSAWSAWSPQISGVVETPQVIAIEIKRRAAYIVPKRAFASPEDAAAFAGAARGFWERATEPDGERLRVYLAGRDVACPGCRYNLRDLTGRRCPECGLTLDLDSLTAAEERSPRVPMA
jgi:hypothetical protein